MFNFFVCLAGRDMNTDAGRNTTCRRNLKPHHYKQKIHKTKDLSKKWFSKPKSLKISDKETTLLAQTKQTRETHGPWKQQLNMAFVNSNK